MLSVAIIEDSKSDRENLEKYLDRYADRKSVV